ncbi:hypothetical protein CA51_03700 [Rosistilla oblonga]|uniref:Carboxypeptidase regulatory-like domain-containing protein n=1 Tax=Rosistilla oblonga TaxID=2527990 RepID=A0A518IMX4_9BACT|nr:hypothetical protein [Rosistilla oblonga]QDV10521.1 hypothetical protein CA51_03700 [Rosistilla oblonga]QDV54446.1 hypothetical protein Mal33_04000 [Rosistilla oblonga]
MIQSPTRISTFAAATLLLIPSLTALVGCGTSDAGPGKYSVTGTVTFEGQPLPEGEILFAPDTASGNKGPASVAYVKDGKFSTQPGMGLVGGAYTLEVTGFQTKAEMDQDGEPIVEPLFDTFVTKHEFEHQDSTYDFAVEPSEKKKRR